MIVFIVGGLFVLVSLYFSNKHRQKIETTNDDIPYYYWRRFDYIRLLDKLEICRIKHRSVPQRNLHPQTSQRRSKPIPKKVC